MHAYHDGLPGFDPGNILHDGCEECEARAADPLHGFTALDHRKFQQAWSDMLAEEWSGGEGLQRNVSRCDSQLMNALYTVAVLLQRNAKIDPRVVRAMIAAHVDALEAKLAERFGH